MGGINLRYYKLKKVIHVDTKEEISFIDGVLTIELVIPESKWEGQLSYVTDEAFYRKLKRFRKNYLTLRFYTDTKDIWEGVKLITRIVATEHGGIVYFEGKGNIEYIEHIEQS